MAQLNPEAEPVDGLGTPELFNNTVRFQDFVRRLVPMLVMLFLFAALICGLVLGYAGMGVVRWLLAALVAAGFCYFLYRGKKRQFEATWPKSTLELSPRGAVSVSGGVRIDLPWSRIHQIGKSDIMGPLRISGGNDVAALAASAATASVRRSADALIGAGTLTLSPEASAMVRAQVAQHDKGQQMHPETGQPTRAIILSHFDNDWRSGRIGQWITAYRPDLIS